MRTTSPSYPAARAACAARSPASPAPAMTMRSGLTGSSVLDPDGHHRAHVDGLLDLGALGVVDVLLPAENVVVAELEDVRSGEDALAVALAEVHVDVDLHRWSSCSLTMRSASSSGIASA